MRALITILVLLSVVLLAEGSDRRRVMLKAKVTAAAAAGPDVWYTNDVAWTADAEYVGNNNQEILNPVVIAQAGTATKLRISVKTLATNPTDIKLALYDPSKNLLTYETYAVTSTGMKEVTLVSPQAVSAATYFVGIEAATDQVVFFLDQTAATSITYGALAYASFPDNPFSGASTITWDFAVGIYVD
jgi:hypothetical protein